MSKLRAAHAAEEDSTRTGVDVLTGGVGDMAELGIYESFKVGAPDFHASPVCKADDMYWSVKEDGAMMGSCPGAGEAAGASVSD